MLASKLYPKEFSFSKEQRRDCFQRTFHQASTKASDTCLEKRQAGTVMVLQLPASRQAFAIWEPSTMRPIPVIPTLCKLRQNLPKEALRRLQPRNSWSRRTRIFPHHLAWINAVLSKMQGRDLIMLETWSREEYK